MNDRNVPATKGDVEDVRTALDQLRQEISQRFDQISQEANHRYDDLVERMSDGETRVLRALYAFAESNNKRTTELEGNEAALRSRMGTFESRLLEVEKRLNIPPTA